MTSITNDREVVYDVHTAEQAALALQSLASMRTRRDSRLLKGAMIKSIDALFEELKSRAGQVHGKTRRRSRCDLRLVRRRALGPPLHELMTEPI